MSKRLSYALSLPVLDTPPAQEDGRHVLYASPDGGLRYRGPSGTDAPVGAALAPNTPEVVVGPTNTLTKPGIWIQTGLGPSGQDWTLWFEDGVA